MKLKLFSGEEWAQAFIDDFADFLKLDNEDLALVLKGIVEYATKRPTASPLLALREKLKIDSDRFDNFAPLISTIAPRVIAGKNSSEVIDDLVSHGLPKSKVEFLFSQINRLSASDKTDLVLWALARTAHNSHVHSLSSNVELLSTIDNGFLVGVAPFAKIQVTAYNASKQQDESWLLELTVKDIEFLMKNLEIFKQELEAATNQIKEKTDVILRASRG